MPRLADPRKITLEDAELLLRNMAQTQARITEAEAKASVRINAIKARLDEDTHADRNLVDEDERILAAWILANPDRFERPRMHRTNWGAFGLRLVTDVVVDDADELIRWARENGYPDLYEEPPPRTRKPAIRKRLDDGQEVPGAHLVSGDVAKWEPAKTLIEDAKERGRGAA